MKSKLLPLLLMVLWQLRGSAQEIHPLYTDSIPNSITNVLNEQPPNLKIYSPGGDSKLNTAILIIPGGAYSFLAYEDEGIKIAEAFATKGIAVFVLKYRIPDRKTMTDKSIGPLMDGQQAIKVIRDNAAQWNVDPNKVGVIGFSAGGHLASTLGTHFSKSYIPNKEGTSLRPDFMVLVYPLISMEDSLTHIGSKISLLGMEPTAAAVADFSNELQVTKETPPTYLTHCEDDRVVDVKNSIVFYRALQKFGVYSELHLVSKGDHGFIQRIPTNEWLDPILKFLSKEGFYNQ